MVLNSNPEKERYKRRDFIEQQSLYGMSNTLAYIRSMVLEHLGHVWRVDGQIIKPL